MEIILVVLCIIIGYYILSFLLGWLLPLHITTEKYLLYLLKKSINYEFILIAKPAIKEIAVYICKLSRNIAISNRGKKLQPYGYEMNDREYAVKFCVTASEDIQNYLINGIDDDNFAIRILKSHSLTREKYNNIETHVKSESLLRILKISEGNNLISDQIATIMYQNIVLPLRLTIFFDRQTESLKIPTLFWSTPYVVGYTITLCQSILLFNFKGFHMTQDQRMTIISFSLYKLCNEQWHLVLNKMLELQKAENEHLEIGISFKQGKQDALMLFKAIHEMIDENEFNDNPMLKEAIILSKSLDDLPGLPNNQSIKLAEAILHLTLIKYVHKTYTAIKHD